MQAAPEYRIATEKNVPARMRDGVVLYADVYRPDAPGRFPVILLRTPYSKEGAVSDYPQFYVPRGYVVVVQDTRGRFTSEGDFYPLVHEALDGYDAVEWAARLPWADGNVGMAGRSYLCATQYLAMAAAPPHLRAIVPNSSAADFHEGWVYHSGGALAMSWIISYALSLARNTIERKNLGQEHWERIAAHMSSPDTFTGPLKREAYYHLPLRDWAEWLRDVAPYFADYLNHPDDGPYWWWTNVPKRHQNVDAAAYHVGTWYDIFLHGALTNYTGVNQMGKPQARSNQRLLVGPWGHLLPYTGDADFGPEGSLEVLRENEHRWLEHWLKGIDNGIMGEPPVRIFVMGDNKWRYENEWPLSRTQYTPYYLHSQGKANGLSGDGVLDSRPPGDELPDSFAYDPSNPVPTRGGNILSLRAGVFDQRPMEERPDVLVYTSAILERDLEVTGPITVSLYAASSAPDTDFTAKLIDVRPDGYAHNVQDGIIRARYRDSRTSPSLIVPGQVYYYTIDLWATSYVFKAGHRIRVDISSSNFPRFDRNPNTGRAIADETELRVAQQTIYHDSVWPSHITLPLIPR